ncbi:MAG: CHAD domain-containing protein [Planctomycetota bacterium]
MSAPAKQPPGGEFQGSKRLRVEPGLPLAESLTAAFAGVIRYASEWAARAELDPEPAVHNFRKSIRRGRALLKLVRGHLARDEYELLVEDLRGAMRETSAARDADVLVALVAAYPRKPKTAPALDALQALLEERRSAVVQGRLGRAMREGAEQLGGLPPRLESLLPAELSLTELREAVRVSYRRARRARLRAIESRDDDDVHAWRKRVKELRYQVELLEPLTGHRPEHDLLAELAEHLGEVTDLVVMRDCLLAYEERLEGVNAAPLLEKLEKRIAKQQVLRLEEAATAFEAAPRAFARHLLQGVGATRESGRLIAPQAPPAPPAEA